MPIEPFPLFPPRKNRSAPNPWENLEVRGGRESSRITANERGSVCGGIAKILRGESKQCGSIRSNRTCEPTRRFPGEHGIQCNKLKPPPWQLAAAWASSGKNSPPLGWREWVDSTGKQNWPNRPTGFSPHSPHGHFDDSLPEEPGHIQCRRTRGQPG